MCPHGHERMVGHERILHSGWKPLQERLATGLSNFDILELLRGQLCSHEQVCHS